MIEELRYFLGNGLLDLGLALLILAVGWVAALVVGKLVNKLMRTFGEERFIKALGVKRVEPRHAPSAVLEKLTRTAIMLVSLLEAFEVLGFEMGGQLITRFLAFGGDVLLGVAILCLGLYLGRLAGDAVISATGRRFRPLGPITQGAVVVLAVFMALDQMGVAENIVLLLFIFTAGAAALAAALAFGLGCRETARQQMEQWLQALREGKDSGEK